jgi:proteasome assembly chaperone (PAC2) family protein
LERVVENLPPNVDVPVVVVATAGAGNVGLIALNLLLKFCDGKKFGELHSKSLPDYITVENSGVCHLPRFDLYSSRNVRPNLVFVMSDSLILSNEPRSHYDVLDEIVEFAIQLRPSLIVGIDGIVEATKDSNAIYASATSSDLVKRFCQFGARVYNAGRLPGSVGLLIGLCEYHGVGGVGILGSTRSFVSSTEAGKRVHDFLTRTLSISKTTESD